MSATPAATGFITIAAGTAHSVAITTDGSIVAWGWDGTGLVSDAPMGAGFTAVAAGEYHSVAIAADGSLVSWGHDSYGQVSGTPSGGGFTAVAAGDHHSVALAPDGSLVSWGDDTNGLVSDTPTGTGFTAIAAGGLHSVAVAADGGVVSWGSDTNGQISNTPAATGFTAVAAGTCHSVALAADGSLASWGCNYNGQVSDTPVGTGFTAVAAGGSHNLTIAADGSLVSWGNDYYRLVSDTPTGAVFTAVAAGGQHSVAITAATPTTTSVTSSVNPSVQGSDVTFTATVSPVGATGDVEFLDGGTSLGSSTVTAGGCGLTSSGLAAGTHSVTAIFRGSTNHLPSHSTPIDQSVVAQTFSDVPPAWPFFTEVEWLAARGITTGFPDGTFRPLEPINRDAMAAFLYRFAGSPVFTPPEVSPFADMTPSTMFYREVTWLAAQGITTGWTEADGTKTFRPGQPINRDAMAVFLYRFAGSPAFTPPEVSPFGDMTPSTQFYPEVTWLASTGITTGWTEPDGTKTFRPQQPINRDAMAAFLHRLNGVLRPLTITTTTLPTATVGVAYTTTVTASGGRVPYAWSATGLPDGLSMSTAGTIAGTPTTAGGAVVVVTVTDAGGVTTQTTLPLTVGFDCATPQPTAPGQLTFSGLAYGPYRLGQSPDAGIVPSPEEVAADLPTLAQLTRNIRIYSSQGPAESIVEAAEGQHVCVGLGVWLAGEAEADAREIAAVGPLAASPAVRSVTVGSEVLLRGDMTVPELRAAIAQVRAAVGPSVEITVADTYNEWLEHPELAEDVDFITVHIYPFWQQVSIDAALDSLENAYAQVEAAFPGRRIVIGETGWPSAGSPFGAAVPSPENQARYVQEFVDWAEENEVEYVFFEAFDESWKVGEGDVGPNWGLYREDGILKPALASLVPPADPQTVWQRSFRDVWVGGLSQGFGLGVDTSGGLHNWVQTGPDRLVMTYPAGQTWGVVYVTAGQPAPPGSRSSIDLSGFSSLVAEVRAPDGEECVRVGIKDVTQPDNGSEKTAPVFATSEWTPVVLPLGYFTGVDTSRLYMVFEVVFEGTAGGVIEVRNVRYSPDEATPG